MSSKPLCFKLGGNRKLRMSKCKSYVGSCVPTLPSPKRVSTSNYKYPKPTYKQKVNNMSQGKLKQRKNAT